MGETDPMQRETRSRGTIDARSYCYLCHNVRTLRTLSSSSLSHPLSQLLSPSLSYHSMATHFTTSYIQQNGLPTLTLTHTFTLVHDHTTPVPGQLAPEWSPWSLSSIYGTAWSTSCPLTSSPPSITLHPASAPYASSFSPPFPSPLLSHAITAFPFDMKCTEPPSVTAEEAPSQPPITFNRFQTNAGQNIGSIVSRITNNDPNVAQHIQYWDSLPWFLPLAFSSIKITQCSSSITQQSIPFHSLFSFPFF
eukprot:TRINITY_DN3424_c2_g1_i2.p1 TRINITY_DN3424_c2_g1~~TRINITY_DN3424_c2_g1_i2.p1  ORF type:complete len:250 (+),score=22.47 TRINITY_DN3424_c2_g1_i2:215-964(+)